MKKTLNTNELTAVLEGTSPDRLPNVLAEQKENLLTGDKPFSDLLRQLLAKYGKTQRAVIEAAGFSEKYGYRLLAEVRHTRQRDYILRICITGTFSVDETNRLLTLYGMAPLYARTPRDAVLIACISAGSTIDATDRALIDNGFDPLKIGLD